MLQPFKETKHEYKYLKNINRLECFQHLKKKKLPKLTMDKLVYIPLYELPVPKH